MMCLSWYNREICKVRGDEQALAPSGVQVTSPQTACPDIGWFWLGVAALVGGAVLKDRK